MLALWRATGARRPAFAAAASRAFSNDTGDIVNVFHETESNVQNFPNIAVERFPDNVVATLLESIDENDIEVKPDGQIYLPEIKYRRILNRAFGPGGWAMVPISTHLLQAQNLSREYAMFAQGRYIAQARGEQQVFDKSGLVTASEGAKSNALMRCCKDLGVASVLWDPIFIAQWKSKYAVEKFVLNQRTNAKSRLWRRNDRTFDYPWSESTTSSAPAAAASTYRRAAPAAAPAAAPKKA